MTEIEVARPEARQAFASRRTLVLRRFARNRPAMAALVILVLLFVGCYALPPLLPWSYTELDFYALQDPPSTDHWFGTNALGQDLLAQILRGMQKSLLIGACVAVISTAIAATIGSVAGYFGGWRDRALMWFVDLLLVVPSFILIAIITPRTKNSANIALLIVLLAGFSWMVSSRMVRGLTVRPIACVASKASRSSLRPTGWPDGPSTGSRPSR